MIKFTIITATICRPELKRCIDSINEQSYSNWEHIIVVDGQDKCDEEIFYHNTISERRREIVILPNGFNNAGNTPRHVASYFATGDYILYLDDDDSYINNTLEELAKVIDMEIIIGNNPDWGFFKAERFGQVFFNDPPGHSMTTNNQIFHKPIIKEQHIRYTTRDAYCADGELIEDLKNLSKPLKVETEKPLVLIDISHGAKRD